MGILTPMKKFLSAIPSSHSQIRFTNKLCSLDLNAHTVPTLYYVMSDGENFTGFATIVFAMFPMGLINKIRTILKPILPKFTLKILSWG
jgi:hypothetical protein